MVLNKPSNKRQRWQQPQEDSLGTTTRGSEEAAQPQDRFQRGRSSRTAHDGSQQRGGTNRKTVQPELHKKPLPSRSHTDVSSSSRSSIF